MRHRYIALHRLRYIQIYQIEQIRRAEYDCYSLSFTYRIKGIE